MHFQIYHYFQAPQFYIEFCVQKKVISIIIFLQFFCELDDRYIICQTVLMNINKLFLSFELILRQP